MERAFSVVLVGQALKQLKKLPSAQQEEALDQLLRELETNPLPRPPLIRKISGIHPPIFRVRLTIHHESWRAFYNLTTAKVRVFGLVSKKEADRFLKHLQ